MLTMEAETSLNLTYAAPASDYSGINYTQGFGQWAAQLNGKNVAKSGENLSVQPTASTAKMIMALAVMEKKPFVLGETGETITITDELYNIYADYVAVGGSTTAMGIGEEISEYDALSSALIASSNNMADSLTIWAFGSIEDYQKYATEMLVRLGAKNTKLGTKDASGYDSSTVSTASDLARIGYFVMREPVLAEIVAKEKAEVPVAGEIPNTNKLLGKSSISGVKTGYIGDESGYCIVSGYKKDEHIITVAVLGSATRDGSFDNNLTVVKELQSKLVDQEIFNRGDEVGYYESWWTGKVALKADESFAEMNYKGAENLAEISDDVLKMKIGEINYDVALQVPDFSRKPNIFERFLHVFGWKK